MTSEVKGHLNRDIENPMKYMYKNFQKNIMSGWWVRTFQSYNFILNDSIEKFSKGNSFNIFFGHSMTSEVKGHIYKVVDKPLNFMHTKFCTDILTGCLVICFLRKCKGRILYLRQNNLHVVDKFKGQTFNNI